MVRFAAVVGFLSAIDRRGATALAVAVIVGGCTVVSGVGDLSFDLDPAGAGGSGGSGGQTTTSTGGAGGGSDGAGGMAPPALDPTGEDFPVGTMGPAGGFDFQPGLSVTGDGTFVVAWSDFGSPAPDADFSGIFYDTFTDTTCATCFAIANVTTTAGSQLAARGAGVPSGSATLYGWTSTSSGNDGAQLIFIESDGSKTGGELTIPSGDWIAVGAPWSGFTGAPAEVTAAWLADDSSTLGVYTTRLAPGASAVPAGTLVNVDEVQLQNRPAIGVDGSGRALIAWVDKELHIRARLVDANGTPVGDDISIDDDIGANCAPAVAAAAERFIVVYAKGTCGGAEFPAGGQVFAVAVDRDGTPRPPVAVSTDSDATTPDVAFDGEHYVVVWSQVVPGDGGRAIRRRRLWQDGSTADEFSVDVHPVTSDRAECLPVVAADAAGRVAIAWSACDAGCVGDRAFPPNNTNTCKVRMRYFE